MSRSRFRTALGWAFVLNWGRQGAATVVTFVLASLLGPDAFGTVALAQVYLLFIEMFQEQGLTNALIQRKNLEDRHLDTAFWLNIALSLFLWGGSLVFAPYYAKANDVPELVPVITVLSLTLPIQALTVVQQAVLQRALDFRSLAVRTNVSVWVGGGIGIGMALAGYGVWALVGQSLSVATASLALLWSLSGWRPRMRFDPRALGELLGFSSGALLARLGLFSQRRGEVAVMGMMFSPAAVGLYRLAQRLMELPLELSTRSVQTVSLSAFSRDQDDPAALRRGVTQGIWIGSTLAVPALFVIAAIAPDLLAVMGGQWPEAALALQILCIAGAVRAAVILAGPLLQARGRPHQMAALAWLWGAIGIGSAIAVGIWLADAPVVQQVAGIAASRAAVALLLQLPVHLGILVRHAGLRVRDLVGVFAPALASGAAAYAVASLARTLLPLSVAPAWLRLAVYGSLTITAAVVVLTGLDGRAREAISVASRRLSAIRATATPRQSGDTHL